MANDGIGRQQERQHQNAQRVIVEDGGQQAHRHQCQRGDVKQPGHLSLPPALAQQPVVQMLGIAFVQARRRSLSAARLSIRRMARRHTASTTSNSGTPTASNGTPRPAMNGPLEFVEIDSAASVNPRNRLPASPKNTLAGWKL